MANRLLVGNSFVFETKLKTLLCNACAVWRVFASARLSLQPGRSSTGTSRDGGFPGKASRAGSP